MYHRFFGMKAAILVVLLIFCLLTPLQVRAFSASASDEPKIELETPREIEEYLPSIETMTPTDVQNAFDFRFFSETGVKILAEAFPEAAKSFALLLGLLLVSAVLSMVKSTLSDGMLQTALNLASLAAMAAAVFSVTGTAFSFADGYIETLSSFMKSVAPTMAAFMAGSGKFTSASVISGVIYLALSLLETLMTEMLFPLVRLSLALAVVCSLFDIPGIAGIAPYIRKLISYIFAFVTISLSAVLLFQGMIAKSADSVALRGIKFAIGSFVPFVGGAVNEALTTVIGGLGTIKTATGVVGAVSVLLIAAVPVIRTLVYKFFLELLSLIATLLGLSGETRLLQETASYLGYTGAVMAITAVFFVLSLSMMMTA